MNTKAKADRLVYSFSECGEDNEMYIKTAIKCAICSCNDTIKTLKTLGNYASNIKLSEYTEIKNELESRL